LLDVAHARVNRLIKIIDAFIVNMKPNTPNIGDLDRQLKVAFYSYDAAHSAS
jgi:hypothetical protein